MRRRVVADLIPQAARNQRRPSGLMAGPAAAARVGVEIFVKVQ